MSDLHALLIGIDAYLPNTLPNGGSYKPLGGCVQDVLRVEEYLKSRLGLPAERIAKLTATVPPAVGTGSARGPAEFLPPKECPNLWPTYANMVAAFQRLKETAQHGDEVYIHYSGHGGRAKTEFPEVKGEGGFDEGLVPCDIGRPGGQYLRDIPLAYLLEAMVAREIRITLVLDSCHSGGATRDDTSARARGPWFPHDLAKVDTTPRPVDRLVASPEELAATWTKITSDAQSRHMSGSTPWLRAVKGYVLLAACAADEKAYECTFEEGVRGGALTHWLLDALRRRGPNMTYRELYDRLVAKVHSQFRQQNPVILGEANRVVFGAGEIARRRAITVLSVDEGSRRVRLSAGQAQGVRDGARFALYPPGANLDDTAGRLGTVKVVEYDAIESSAEIEGDASATAIEPGAQALLFDLGSLQLQNAVRVLYSSSPSKARDEGVLGKIADLVAKEAFLQTAKETEPADFHVALRENGEIEIQDAAEELLPDLGPALFANDVEAPAKTIDRLVHLTRYQVVEQLENFDPSSQLAGKLQVDLLGVQEKYDRADRPRPQAAPLEGGILEMFVGQWTFLRIANRSSRRIHIAVFDLQPDWGISQVHPASDEDDSWLLDPNQEFVLPLQGGLPDGLDEGVDVLKVFAALAPSSFRWFELPALDQPRTRPAEALRSPANPLEQLFQTIASNSRRTRHFEQGNFPTQKWTAAQVEVKIRRRPS